MDKDAIVVRYSEIAVKGWSTRRRMERLLVNAIKESLDVHGVSADIDIRDGRIFLWNPSDINVAVDSVSRVFGVKSLSPAYVVRFKSLEDLIEKAKAYFAGKVRSRVFRVRARRVGAHDFTSKDVERLLGAELLAEGASGVDLENPEYTAYVEIRGSTAILYDKVVKGPGGLPIGSEDPILILFSGGFDSTVSSWMLMKRGSPVHFLLFDLGNVEAVKIAVTAAKAIVDGWGYGYEPRLYLSNLKGISIIISGLVRPEYRILVLRRYMMEYAVRLAESLGIEAIATGESLGQVASQTIRSLYLISSGLKLPVLRPVIGMDKDEITELSRRIGVYDIVSRQIEVCGQAPNPTPRGNHKLFWAEYDKIVDAPAPEPRELNLKRSSLNELLALVSKGIDR